MEGGGGYLGAIGGAGGLGRSERLGLGEGPEPGGRMGGGGQELPLLVGTFLWKEVVPFWLLLGRQDGREGKLQTNIDSI